MKKTILAAMCGLALASAVAAQKGGPPSASELDVRGGPGGANLLLMPDVQKELQLTASQKEKIKELFTLEGEKGASGRREEEEEEGVKTGPEGRANKVKEILSEKQFARYFQLTLQYFGPTVISQKEVAAKLVVTDVQKDKIRAAIDKMRPRPQSRGQRLDPQLMFKEMDKKKAVAEKAILAALTVTQRSKWQGMLGKPFKFENQKRPVG